MKGFIIFLSICFCAGIIRAEDEEKKSSTSGLYKVGEFHTREALLDKLFTNYKKHNHPDHTRVKFGIGLLDLDFDIDKSIMVSDVWYRLVWNDTRLQWDNKTNGVDVLRIPAEMVWRPDIFLYSGKQVKTQCVDSNVLIYPNGEVLWVPPCQIQSYCNLTLAIDPYKEQKCILKFGSWTFDGLVMDMQLYNNEPLADLSDYWGLKYAITKNEAKRHEKYYPCCKEPYMDITYTLGITRIPDKSEYVCDKE